MKKYLFVATGAFLGAICRFLFAQIPFLTFNILIANLLGAFVMAFIMTLSAEALPVSPELKTGMTTGFCGSFTTFSTLCKEAVSMLLWGALGMAMLYMIVSLVGGLLLSLLGIRLAKGISLRKERRAE